MARKITCQTKVRKQTLSFLILLTIILMVAPALADTITIMPDADTYVSAASPTINFGTSTVLYVISGSTPARTLIHHNLAALPAGAVIDQAVLHLYTAVSSGTRTHAVHRVTASWTESTVTWNLQPTYDPSPADSKLMGGTGSWMELDVTADVQEFIAGTANYGWIVKDSTESGTGLILYRSKEVTTAAQRPYLEVTYHSGPTPPVANFTASPLTGTAPLLVQFTDLSTGDGITDWAWDFTNDGTVDSIEQNPEYIYTSAGTYTVKLTVTNAGGSDSEVKTDYITVSEPLPDASVADFTATPLTGTVPLTVQFTDQSTGDEITDWAWDFTNDGTVDSTEQNPEYIYTSAGTYTVKLTVTNAAGSDDEVKVDYITVTEPAPQPVLNNNTGIRYATIQAAVSAATAGDEIIVGDRSFTENVEVDKQLVIRSENGSASVTVTAASPTLPVFDVNANGVVIQGFTVRGPTNTHVAGIEIVDFNDCLVIRNDCSGCYNGIHIGGTGTYNTIEENYCHGNTQRGISVRDTAHDNYIAKNIVEGNTDAGICIKDSAQDNVLWLNDVISNRVEILTANTVHSPEPITYLYNGGTYTSYLGNYYSDYAGTDTDGNGVGTPAYSYGTYGDDYPLVARFSSYTETAPAVFLWGPYLTGTTNTGTTVNVKTDIATTAMVEYATDTYYTANSGYDQSANSGASTQLHHVALTGLAPGTLYHYRVSCGGATSGDLHFLTFPADGSITFVVYSDTQDQLPTFSQLERHKLVADRIAEEEDVLFVLNAGDLVNNAANLADWDRYFAAGRTMMANTTVYPVLGNHEDNNTNYYEIYGVPEWYSFDCAGTHVAVLDTNDEGWARMPEQSAWLQNDLSNAAGADWKFVSFHHPPYTSESNHFGGYENVRLEWEDDFIANDVDAVFNGHVHAYERFLANNISYFVIATGGGPAYNLVTPRAPGSQNSLEYALGYLKVTIDPSSGSATVEMIRVADVSGDLKNITTVYPPDTVFETVVLTNGEPPVAPVAAFISDVQSGTFPLTVKFIDQSTGDPTAWAWDFENDGTVDSSEQNATHTYAIAGNYTVNLTVTNADGSDSEVKTDYITVTATGTPTISFIPKMNAIGVGSQLEYLMVVNTLPAGLAGFNLNVTLDNPGIGTITALTVPAWATLNGSSALPADSITFNTVDLEKQIEPGATNITIGTVTVRGDTLGTTNISVTMEKMDADGGDVIVPLLNPGRCVVYQPLTANFTAEPLTGTVPLTVNFTDLSTGDPLPATWTWDFENDGVVDSIEQNPAHTYSSDGNYTVNLTVSNEYDSDSSVKTSLIQVRPLVEAFPGYTNPPTDPDGDGLFEDINGNGHLDFDDVVAYYQNMQWIRDNTSVGIGPFDLNHNGRIDFDDVVVLYDRVLNR